VDQRGLLVFQTLCYITTQAEVRVLVDGAGNQRGNVPDTAVGPEDVREGCGKGGGGLDRSEVELSDVVTTQIRRSALLSSDITRVWAHGARAPCGAQLNRRILR